MLAYATARPIRLIAPATIVLLTLIVAAGCAFGGFAYRGTDLDTLFALAAFVSGYGLLICAARRGSRIGASMVALGLFAAMSLLTTLATAVMAPGGVPYIDGALAFVDRTLFRFDWPAANLALAAHPWTLTALSYAYLSLNWQPLVLFVAMACHAKADVARFIAVWSLGLLGCVLPFHWLPARGAYVHFGIPFEAMHGLLVHLPWNYPVALEGLRDGTIRTLGTGSLVGLVTVPSFHACAAVMLGWGFSRIPVLRWPFGLLNATMFVSAVPIGGHYVTDIAAGLIVAVAAILLVDRLQAAPVPRLAASPVFARA